MTSCVPDTTNPADISDDVENAGRYRYNTEAMRAAWCVIGNLILDAHVHVNFEDPNWAEHVKSMATTIATTLIDVY